MAFNDAGQLPRLVLLRHGDTDWTDSHQHTGRTDLPLNADGEPHAHRLGARLTGKIFARVFVSPLLRVRRTCELAGFAEHAEVNADLTEWDYGDYESKLTADIHRQRPQWNLYRDATPKGESPEQVAARADRYIELVRPIDGDVAAFSSGQLIHMIAARWLGLSAVHARHFYTATASIGILGYEHDRNQPVLLLWDDDQQVDRAQKLIESSWLRMARCLKSGATALKKVGWRPE
jgi:broad specificity phosphatase PhoE